MYEVAETLAEALLRLHGGMLIGCIVQTGCGDFGSEPVGLGEALDQGEEVLFDLLLRDLVADLVQGLDGLLLSIRGSSG